MAIQRKVFTSHLKLLLLKAKGSFGYSMRANRIRCIIGKLYLFVTLYSALNKYMPAVSLDHGDWTWRVADVYISVCVRMYICIHLYRCFLHFKVSISQILTPLPRRCNIRYNYVQYVCSHI